MERSFLFIIPFTLLTFSSALENLQIFSFGPNGSLWESSVLYGSKLYFGVDRIYEYDIPTRQITKNSSSIAVSCSFLLILMTKQKPVHLAVKNNSLFVVGEGLCSVLSSCDVVASSLNISTGCIYIEKRNLSTLAPDSCLVISKKSDLLK